MHRNYFRPFYPRIPNFNEPSFYVIVGLIFFPHTLSFGILNIILTKEQNFIFQCLVDFKIHVSFTEPSLRKPGDVIMMYLRLPLSPSSLPFSPFSRFKISLCDNEVLFVRDGSRLPLQSHCCPWLLFIGSSTRLNVTPEECETPFVVLMFRPFGVEARSGSPVPHSLQGVNI